MQRAPRGSRRLAPKCSPYRADAEPGGDRAAVVAILRVRPDKLTRPEITTEVVEVGSAVAVWEGTLLGGTDEGVLVQAAADLELRESLGHGVLTIPKEAVLDKLYRDDGMKLWVAEGGGCSALKRLESVPGTAFAGIWGGVPRTDGHLGQVGTPDGPNADSQRLDRVLPARFLNAPAWSRPPRRLPTSGSARSRATRPGEPRKPPPTSPGPSGLLLGPVPLARGLS